jgi:hypothetical protein
MLYRSSGLTVTSLLIRSFAAKTEGHKEVRIQARGAAIQSKGSREKEDGQNDSRSGREEATIEWESHDPLLPIDPVFE